MKLLVELDETSEGISVPRRRVRARAERLFGLLLCAMQHVQRLRHRAHVAVSDSRDRLKHRLMQKAHFVLDRVETARGRGRFPVMVFGRGLGRRVLWGMLAIGWLWVGVLLRSPLALTACKDDCGGNRNHQAGSPPGRSSVSLEDLEVIAATGHFTRQPSESLDDSARPKRVGGADHDVHPRQLNHHSNTEISTHGAGSPARKSLHRACRTPCRSTTPVAPGSHTTS